MRFLKTKISLAQKARTHRQEPPGSHNKSQSKHNPEHEVDLIDSSKGCIETKNMSINYGRAIITFATSYLALPYLKDFQQGHMSFSLTRFIHFMEQAKNGVTGINGLRSLLLIEQDNNSCLVLCKKAFQWISEVFIKYFSVNWIIHGKMTHKLTYLKYRYKMLRRVQKPDLFTYVRSTQGKRKRAVKLEQGCH